MRNPLYDALFAPHKNSDRPFLVLDDDTLSYAEFIAMAGRIANVLRDNGVAPGDRIVAQAPKRPELLALYAATVGTGAVFLPLNTAYTADEVAYFLGDAEPKLIVATGQMAEQIGSHTPVLTLHSDGSGTLADAMSSSSPAFEIAPRAPDDLAALLYTSGTTGRSKGAMLTHDNLLSNTQVLVGAWQITSEDRLIHALPIYHTHGLFVAMNTCLLVGAQVRFLPTFDLDTILDELPQSTLLMGVPTFYTRLLGDARLTRERTAGMRLFTSGSAPLLAETHQAFTARTGHAILERYGMTETNMTTSNPYDGERRPGTVGRPLPGVELRLTEPGSDAPAESDVGMIEVRGPNVFRGYWRMPDKTAEELRGDGWFITGDLGSIDADGYVSIVGREKDLIITGGLNVYPKEIEDVLNHVDGVVESAVYGVPDADFGEKIIADVVVTGAVSVDSLRAEVEAKLARFKHPREYRIVAALPRNTMGKVQKNILRQDYAPG